MRMGIPRTWRRVFVWSLRTLFGVYLSKNGSAPAGSQANSSSAMDPRSRGSPSLFPSRNAFSTIAEETGPQKMLLSWLMK